MGINGISLLKAPTAFNFTGGTPVVLEDDSTPVKRGIHVIDVADSNFATRRHATFKTLQPVRQGNGTFSKGRREINFTIPIQNATTGEISYQGVDINFGITYDITPEILSELRYFAAQVILDAEADTFFSVGSTK